MIVTRVFPGRPLAIDLDDPPNRERLLELYRPDRPAELRVNLIASVSGALGGADGTSHSLSNPVDRKILGVIRELADVVLVGAGTVRREGYLMPRRSALAVVTATGELTGHALQHERGASGRLIVLTLAASAARVRAQLPDAEIAVLPSADGRLHPEQLVSALRDRGLPSIVCEGGPHLAGSLLDAGLVDEVCLATAPVITGATVGALAGSITRDRPATLRHLLVDDGGAVYARWALTPGAPATA